MKTPEEIKNGLECCISDTYGCYEKCPYFNSLSNGVDCAVKMHADALAYIKQLEARAPKWISVKDRLPENYEPAIIFQDNCRNACYGWMIDGRWSVPEWVSVTHWMPLPEPPKEE